QIRGKWLDRFRDVELAGHRAALAHEQIFANYGLPWLEFVPSGATNECGGLAKFLQVELDRNAIEPGQGHGDLAESGVGRSLTHAIDGPLNPVGASANGGDSASGCHAEVIVPMKVQRDLRTRPLADSPNKELDGFGAAGADGIDNDEFLGTSI